MLLQHIVPMPFRKGIAITCDSHAVINDKKVTDHHAVIPTRNLKDADLSADVYKRQVECRTADKELKTLNEDGEIGLARLFSLWARCV